MKKCLSILSVLIFLLSPTIISDAYSQDVKPFITNAQFMEILVDMGVNGATSSLPVRVTKGLGLTHNNETLTVRLDSFKDDAERLHFIARLDNDAGYIVSVADSQSAHDFLVNTERRLVKAISITEKDGVVLVPNKNAQKLLDAEWLYWAGMAEQLGKSGINKN